MGKLLVYLSSNKKMRKLVKMGNIKIVKCQVCGKWGFDTGWHCPRCGWTQDFTLDSEDCESMFCDITLKDYREYYKKNKKNVLKLSRYLRFNPIYKIKLWLAWKRANRKER